MNGKRSIAWKAGRLLAAHASEILLLSQVSSLQGIAEYFSREFGQPISRRQVDFLMKKIRQGKARITEEEVIVAAAKHGAPSSLVRQALSLVQAPKPAKNTPVSTDSHQAHVLPKAVAPPRKQPDECIADTRIPAKGPVPENIWLSFAKETALPIDTVNGNYLPEEHARLLGPDGFEKLTDDDFRRLAGYLNVCRLHPDRGSAASYDNLVEQKATEIKKSIKRTARNLR